MAMKCCTKLETAKERCPIVFQGHPSNFKVTWDKTSPILTQIGRFRTIGRSQLSNPSDLPCFLSILEQWLLSLLLSSFTISIIFYVHICFSTIPEFHKYKGNTVKRQMRRELSSALLLCMVYHVDLADHGLFLIQICSVGACEVDYTPWSWVKKV